jgi:hypothetical protein
MLATSSKNFLILSKLISIWVVIVIVALEKIVYSVNLKFHNMWCPAASKLRLEQASSELNPNMG